MNSMIKTSILSALAMTAIAAPSSTGRSLFATGSDDGLDDFGFEVQSCSINADCTVTNFCDIVTGTCVGCYNSFECDEGMQCYFEKAADEGICVEVSSDVVPTSAAVEVDGTTTTTAKAETETETDNGNSGDDVDLQPESGSNTVVNTGADAPTNYTGFFIGAGAVIVAAVVGGVAMNKMSKRTAVTGELSSMA